MIRLPRTRGSYRRLNVLSAKLGIPGSKWLIKMGSEGLTRSTARQSGGPGRPECTPAGSQLVGPQAHEHEQQWWMWLKIVRSSNKTRPSSAIRVQRMPANILST